MIDINFKIAIVFIFFVYKLAFSGEKSGDFGEKFRKKVLSNT